MLRKHMGRLTEEFLLLKSLLPRSSGPIVRQTHITSHSCNNRPELGESGYADGKLAREQLDGPIMAVR